jgi:beta-lactam-binding protein with PASTA domain
MRKCSCGAESPDDAGFCPRGHFLGWTSDDAGSTVSGVGDDGGDAATTATLVPVVPAADRGAGVQLSVPGQPAPAAGGPVVEVMPGESVKLFALVRNEAEHVDTYDVWIDAAHMPRDWWRAEPSATAKLMSFTDPSGFDAEIYLTIAPPAAPEAVARDWEVDVIVKGRVSGVTTRAPVTVRILPFARIEARARPRTVEGRHGADLDAQVTNLGNTDVTVDAGGEDPDARVEVERGPAMLVPRGETVPLPLRAVPVKRLWYARRPWPHQLTLHAATVEIPGPPKVASVAAREFPATYRQVPLIAWWLPLLVLLLLLLGVLLYFLLQPTTVTVPRVVKARSVFEAQTILARHDLKLDDKVRSVATREARGGNVIRQAPGEGAEVEKGSTVAVVVARGTLRTSVPDLDGLDVADAEVELRAKGLTLGEVRPSLEAPGVVSKQIPKAGEKLRSGQPVAIVLSPEPSAKKEPAKKKQGGDAGPKPVPALPEKGGVAAAKAAIEKAGLTPIVELVIHPSPRSTVLRTKPGEGAPPPKDGAVTLVVSAGFPRLAFDNTENALLVSGVGGAPRPSIAGDAEVASGSAWSEDGRRVAFSRNGLIFVTTPGDKKKKRLRLRLGEERTARQPAFAPVADRNVIAFADAKGAEDGVSDALCWTQLGKGKKGSPNSVPSCQDLTGWTVTGISWHTDGDQMLVSVDSVERLNGFGVLRLTSPETEWSVDAARWTAGKLVTKRGAGTGVRAASFEPDGGRIALVTNLLSDEFRLATVETKELESDDLLPQDPKLLPVPACDVAWRNDSAEVAVVQAGNGCDDPVGPIVRLRPGDPRKLTTLVSRSMVLRGRHPSFEPVELDKLSLGR